jgi:phage/plasmid-associated DNA primase
MKNSEGLEGPTETEQINNTIEEFNGLYEKGEQYQPYFPDVNDVSRSILFKYHFKTLKDNETDAEPIYLYINPDYKFEIIEGKKAYSNQLRNPGSAGIYIRDESQIKKIIQNEYLNLLKEQLEYAKSFDFVELDKKQKLIQKLETKIKRIGVKFSEIKEIMQKIRIGTFADRGEINPDSHIPLRSGLLNLKTWEIEPFRADKFYTYKIQGDFDPAIRSLNDIPKFRDLLLSAFPPNYAVTILDYFAYCYYTAYPMQKVLMMAGIHRRGKGTLVRIIQNSMPEGFRRIELEKILSPENRFALQGIEGKKVLVDFEISRDSKRRLSFTKFNSLFGGDTLDMEEKFRISHDIVGKFAGILIGNIPLFYVNDSAFLSRLLIVVSTPEPISTDIPDLDKRIWEDEGAKIVAYLLNRLRNLANRNFKFSNQLSYSEYAELWHLLTDSVQIFLEQNYVEDENAYVREDLVYSDYHLFCNKLGLIPETKHNFAFKFGKTFPRKRLRINKELTPVFYNCSRIINKPQNPMKEEKEECFPRDAYGNEITPDDLGL